MEDGSFTFNRVLQFWPSSNPHSPKNSIPQSHLGADDVAAKTANYPFNGPPPTEITPYAMTEDQALKHWTPLVDGMAFQYGRLWRAYGLDGEDVKTVAMMAIVKAIRTFEPSKGIALRAWVRSEVVWSVLQENQRLNQLIGGCRPVHDDGKQRFVRAEPEERVTDELPATDELEPVESRVVLRNLMDNAQLTPIERSAVNAWLRGKTTNADRKAMQRVKSRIRQVCAA
jgi:hypothetical protein